MKSIMMFLFMFLGINFTLTAQNSKLKIEVSGFEEITGKLSIGLFNDPDNFPKKNESNLGSSWILKIRFSHICFQGSNRVYTHLPSIMMKMATVNLMQIFWAYPAKIMSSAIMLLVLLVLQVLRMQNLS